MLTRLIWLLFGLNVHDAQCGYRAFSAEAYEKIKWSAEGYSVEAEMIANTAKADLQVGFIDIKTIYNDKHKGTTVTDGLKILWDMILWKLR